MSVTHPLCNVPPYENSILFFHLFSYFMPSPKMETSTPRLLSAHPLCAHAHPAPRLLPLFSASTLPWLLLLFLWKSSSNPNECVCILHLKWWQKSLWLIISCKSFEKERSGHYCEGLCGVCQKTEEEMEEHQINSRSVNKRPSCFLIRHETRGDHKRNSCCTLLYLMNIFIFSGVKLMNKTSFRLFLLCFYWGHKQTHLRFSTFSLSDIIML